MKTALSLLFILITHSVFSQDTIFFKNAGKIVVFVKEISQTEIQYKKAELPDGPMYIISKNDIEKIVYKNGYTEIIKKAAETTPNNNNNNTTQTFEVYNSAADINTEKITYQDTKKRYSSVVTLIDRHPDPNRRSSLMQSAQTLISLKRHQDGTRTGAIIFCGFAIGGIAVYTLASEIVNNGSSEPIFIVPPVLFGTLAVIFGATSIAININLKKKRHDFVNDYNQ